MLEFSALYQGTTFSRAARMQIQRGFSR